MPKITTVIAAGGLGTRLIGYKGNDSTKMLLKVNNLSMISHQLNQLIGWGLDDFVIVTNPLYDNMIREDVKNNFNKVKIKFVLQQEQLGVSHALLQSEKAVPKNNMIIYILGDNFFEYPQINLNFLKRVNSNTSYLFTKEVQNPEEFGVVEILDNKVISIIEKPSEPKSNLIAVGLYLFPSNCFNKIREIQPSDRGEYEITSLLEDYMKSDNLEYKKVNGWWIDAGTPEAIKRIETLI
jgi:glucose-1-phosphate thymidylyltransferase